TASAAHSRLRATRLDAFDPLVSDLKNVIEFEVLDRTGRRREAQNGVLSFCVKNEAGRVSLGVAADDQDPLTQLDQCGECVLRGRGFTDPAFAIKCDLTELAHWFPCLFGRWW